MSIEFQGNNHAEHSILPGSKGIDKAVERNANELANTGSLFRRRLVGAALTAGFLLTSCGKEQPTVQPSPQPSPVVSGGGIDGVNEDNSLNSAIHYPDILNRTVLPLELSFSHQEKNTTDLVGHKSYQSNGSVITEYPRQFKITVEKDGISESFSIPKDFLQFEHVQGGWASPSDFIMLNSNPNLIYIGYAFAKKFAVLDRSTKSMRLINLPNQTEQSFFSNPRRIIERDGAEVIYLPDMGEGKMYRVDNYGNAKLMDQSFPYIRDILQDKDSKLIVTTHGDVDVKNSSKICIYDSPNAEPIKELLLENVHAPTKPILSNGNLVFRVQTDNEQPKLYTTGVLSLSEHIQGELKDPFYLDERSSWIPSEYTLVNDNIVASVYKENAKGTATVALKSIPLTKDQFVDKNTIKKSKIDSIQVVGKTDDALIRNIVDENGSISAFRIVGRSESSYYNY